MTMCFISGCCTFIRCLELSFLKSFFICLFISRNFWNLMENFGNGRKQLDVGWQIQPSFQSCCRYQWLASVYPTYPTFGFFFELLVNEKFGRSVNNFNQVGQIWDYAHHITSCLPWFSELPGILQCCIKSRVFLWSRLWNSSYDPDPDCQELLYKEFYWCKIPLDGFIPSW